MFRRDDPIFSTVRHCGHDLPGTWRYLLPGEFFALRVPVERLSTCRRCPMVAAGEYTDAHRCCTHFAQIPNFQLGLALKDPMTRGAVLDAIDTGLTLPEGIEISPAHYRFSTRAYAEGLFGRSDDLRCHFMDPASGGCRIYAYRTTICSTFHCGFDHCDAGSAFWDDLTDFVGQVETAVDQWAMEAAGMPVDGYIARKNRLAHCIDSLSAAGSRGWSADALAALWGPFRGREADFFEACADRVMGARHQLWDIASGRRIQNADRFDAALEQWVNGDLDTAPGSDGLDDDAPFASVAELFETLQDAADALWALPETGAILKLETRVVISKNPKNDPLSRFFDSHPWVLHRPSHAPSPLLDRMFLTDVEAAALAHFESPRVVNADLFSVATLRALDAPKAFLAMCLRCGLLGSRTTVGSL